MMYIGEALSSDPTAWYSGPVGGLLSGVHHVVEPAKSPEESRQAESPRYAAKLRVEVDRKGVVRQGALRKQGQNGKGSESGCLLLDGWYRGQWLAFRK